MHLQNVLKQQITMHGISYNFCYLHSASHVLVKKMTKEILQVSIKLKSYINEYNLRIIKFDEPEML